MAFLMRNTEKSIPVDAVRTALKRVIKAGLCSSCGLCVSLDRSGKSRLLDTDTGPMPLLSAEADFALDPRKYCPGLGIDYAALYISHYGAYPANWLMGPYEELYIGYSKDAEIRAQASSGGVLTQVLVHLLSSGLVDAVVLAKQGVPRAHLARAVVLEDVDEIRACAQSIYSPVAMLELLLSLDPAKRYAITLLPDAAAVLRKLQADGLPQACAIKYVLGPYTGTQIYPMALKYFFKALRIKDFSELAYLKWRAGEWPGYLEMKSKQGRLVRSRKIYYNFLIPFYITQSSRLGIDFANEFCDLSVGDAWSPAYEAKGLGFSVVAARNAEMQKILSDLSAADKLHLEPISWEEAGAMHGHMLDFKKRGSFIRMHWRQLWGRDVPLYSIVPQSIALSRYLVEMVNIALFAMAGTTLARSLLQLFPEPVLGPIFNALRLKWKALSKPAKRKGLGKLQMKIKPYER